MDCDDALHRVYEYLDGEMTVWRRRAITRHLDECPPCADGLHLRGRAPPDRRLEVPAKRCPADAAARIAEALGIVGRRAESGAESRPDDRTVCTDPPAARTFYDELHAPSRGGTVRPSDRSCMLIARVIIALGCVGLVLGIYVFADHSGGKLWFYWIAPLLAIGFVAVMIAAGGRRTG